MALSGGFGRAFCLAVDARGYGRADDRRQSEWQHAMVDVLDAAATAAGLHRQTWKRQAKGDEELAVLPNQEPEPVVVDDFVRKLDGQLELYNADRLPRARLRLRVAMHHGVAFAGRNGIPGQGVVVASRLLNSDAAHEALKTNTNANMVLILSDQLYHDVVAQRHTSWRPREFRCVTARCKEYTSPAWLLVPGYDAIDLGSRNGGTQHCAESADIMGGSGVTQQSVTQGHSHSVQAGRHVIHASGNGNGPVFGPLDQHANNINNMGHVYAPGGHFGPIYGQQTGQDDD